MALTPPPVAPPAAPPLPGEAPSRANPTTFRDLADAFVVWQVGFRDWLAGLVGWLASYITWAGTNVAEMDALQADVQSNADIAASGASSTAADAAAVHADRTALDNRLYPGTYAADPVTRPDGSAVQAGDRYFNTSIARQKTYSGVAWATDNLDAAALAAGSGSSLIGFKLSAIGSVALTLEQELSVWVHAKAFGAIADGTSHPLSERYASLAAAQAVYPWVTALTQEIDTTAVDAAAKALALVGGGNLMLDPGGKFSWKRPTVGSQRGVFLASNTRVQAYGATMQMLDNCDFFTAFPATVEKLTVSADVALNDVALTVAAAGTLAAGDKVFVRLNTAAYDAAEPANWYWASVLSVVGLVVTLDRPAPAAMSVAATTAGNRQIVKPSDLSNVVVEGGKWISSAGGSVEGVVNAQYVHGLTLRNMTGTDCGAGLGIIQYCENVKLDRLYADGIRAETGSKGRLLSLAECDGVDADTITVKNFAAASAAIVVEASCVNVNFRNVLAGCDGTGGSGGRRYVFSSLGQGPFLVDGLTIRGKNIYPSTGSLFLGQPRMRNVHIWAQYTLAGGAGPMLDDMMLGALQYTRRTVSVRIAIPTTASNKAVDLPSGRVIRSRILATSLTGLTGVFLRRDATGLNNGVSLVPAAANVAAENNFDYVDTGANNRNFNDDKQILLTAGGTTPAGNFVYLQLEMLMRDGLNEDAGNSMLTYIDA